MATAVSWITERPHRHGIEGCIRDTGIDVWGLVLRRRLGWSDSSILESLPGLTAGDLDAAWEYAASHPDEIDTFIRRNTEARERMARFYADENFDYPTVERLRALGHDIQPTARRNCELHT